MSKTLQAAYEVLVARAYPTASQDAIERAGAWLAAKAVSDTPISDEDVAKAARQQLDEIVEVQVAGRRYGACRRS